MGNFPFTPRSSSYKGKKYEPSQHQVNMICAKIEEGLASIEEEFLNRWDGVDEELLSLKIRAQLLEKHPKLASFLSTEFQREEGVDIGVVSTANGSYKKKRKIDSGPIIINNIRVPTEVIANIIPYCDRSSVNNLSLTCRGIHHVIHDLVRGMAVTIPWTTRFPWKTSCEYTVSSRDFSRIAVVHKIASEERDASSFFSIMIWDRLHGLIGELECHVPDDGNGVKPVFSPDGQLLLAPLATYSEAAWSVTGVQVVQLPSIAERVVPINVSEHHITRYAVGSLAFVNNGSIAAHCRYAQGIHLWTINRENGNVDLSISQRILADQLLGDYWVSHITSFASKIQNLLATFHHDNAILFRDVKNNQSLVKILCDDGFISDMVFAPDGKLVVTFHNHDNESSGKIYVVDCNVNTIGEIEQPRVMCSSSDGSYEDIDYFSPGGNKLAVQCMNGPRRVYHIIDLQKGEGRS